MSPTKVAPFAATTRERGPTKAPIERRELLRCWWRHFTAAKVQNLPTRAFSQHLSRDRWIFKNSAGLTIAFVGTTFPILISLPRVLNETRYRLPCMMLALVSGFVGVLLSPLHLCLLLSNEYFQTPLPPVYRFPWTPGALLLVAVSLYFFALHG